MNTLANILLTLTVLLLISAIWLTGYWLPLLLTALVTFIPGAAIKGNLEKSTKK